jgi:Flp pilus assembly protein TadD
VVKTLEDNPAHAEFKVGMRFLRDGHSGDAYERLRQAAELEENNPYYLSFLGLSLARSERKWAEALALCERALSLKRNEAQLYLNAAEVYALAGQRDNAIAVLDKGLIYFPLDVRIRRVRTNLGKRRPPVLPFLERAHFLNHNLGKLRHRALGWFRKSEN